MALKLLQFKNNRLPLVNWIYKNLDSRYISHLKDNPKGDHMTDIDPFTVFAIFNRSASAQKRIDICSSFKNYLNRLLLRLVPTVRSKKLKTRMTFLPDWPMASNFFNSSPLG